MKQKNTYVSYPYYAFTARQISELTPVRDLGQEWIDGMLASASVFPTKVSRWVTDSLINWSRVPDDAMFKSVIPQPEMLNEENRRLMINAMRSKNSTLINETAKAIRKKLNPNPSNQVGNIPLNEEGELLNGLQHKYEKTLLVFPDSGQTCHGYCTFCFRFPQFTPCEYESHKFILKDKKQLTMYLQKHKEINDIVFTGGDSMVMSGRQLHGYADILLEDKFKHISSIRFGTRALTFWPFRFLTDRDSDELLSAFKRLVDHGKHVSIMAHILHPRELEPEIFQRAVRSILQTGAFIRTQAPLLRGINDDYRIWAEMWQSQLNLNLIPYYMFIARDTGASYFFNLPIIKAYAIFTDAVRQLNGLGRVVRGPCMSTSHGKIEVLGPVLIGDERVLGLRMIHGKNKEWANKCFYAAYCEDACWFDSLRPAFNKSSFFFEND